MSYPRFSDISRNFAPGWFAAVMGSGVLALTTATLAAYWPPLSLAATVLHWFTTVLFLLLALPWVYQWLRFRPQALQILAHPVQGSFYPTFSIALLVLAAQWLFLGDCLPLALTFWWLGVGVHFVFSLAVLFLVFSGEQVGLEHVTPANFIPAVGLVVMPLAGGPLLANMDGLARDLALLANVIGFGAGCMMYLALLGLTFQRKYLHKPAQGVLTPTIWIHLAPLGVIPLSLLNLSEHLPLAAAHDLAMVVLVLFWGFAVWWLIMACLLTLAARAAGQLPFALSWWGFTFPLGAFVAASLRLHQALGWNGVFTIAVAAWFLLVGLWSVTLLRTLRGVASGAIFQPPR
jgi:C4-dicarboxylate transporter/malic acid transport protein